MSWRLESQQHPVKPGSKWKEIFEAPYWRTLRVLTLGALTRYELSSHAIAEDRPLRLSIIVNGLIEKSDCDILLMRLSIHLYPFCNFSSTSGVAKSQCQSASWLLATIPYQSLVDAVHVFLDFGAIANADRVGVTALDSEPSLGI